MQHEMMITILELFVQWLRTTPFSLLLDTCWPKLSVTRLHHTGRQCQCFMAVVWLVLLRYHLAKKLTSLRASVWPLDSSF